VQFRKIILKPLRTLADSMKEALNLTIRDVIAPEAYDYINELIQARLKGKSISKLKTAISMIALSDHFI